MGSVKQVLFQHDGLLMGLEMSVLIPDFTLGSRVESDVNTGLSSPYAGRGNGLLMGMEISVLIPVSPYVRGVESGINMGISSPYNDNGLMMGLTKAVLITSRWQEANHKLSRGCKFPC